MLIPENNVSAPISSMSADELKASFLMQLQDIERVKTSFIGIPIQSMDKDQVDHLYRSLAVMFDNVEDTHQRILTLEEADDGE